MCCPRFVVRLCAVLAYLFAAILVVVFRGTIGMRKRKLLLVMEAIQMNGAVTGWLGYLGAIDRNEWDIDVFLFDPDLHDGLALPQDVRVLSADSHCVIERVGLWVALGYALKRGRIDLAVKRVVFSVLQRRFPRFRKWNLMRPAKMQSRHYDVAIASSQGVSWEYVMEKVSADKKFLWVDTDVRAGYWRFVWECFKKHVSDSSGIVCVSKAMRNQMRKDNPQWAEKIFAMNYVIDDVRIRRLAAEPSDLPEKKAFRLMTVGRYCQQKGQYLIPGIAAELVKRGLDFEWYIIGPGYELNRAKIEADLAKYGLRDRLFYREGMVNPFSAMATADLYVQPSIFEGYGLTVSEALVTGRYVIASDIPTFREQIDSDEYGLFARLGDEQSFADEIMKGVAVVQTQGWKSRYVTPYTSAKTYDQFNRIVQSASQSI